MNNFLFISYFDVFFLKVYIRPTKSVHPTYKNRAIRPTKSVPHLQKVYIRPTKSVYPTYKKCTSDLQKEFIRPTKSVYPTY